MESKCAPPSKRSFNTRVCDKSSEFNSAAFVMPTEEGEDVSVPWIDVELTPLLEEFCSIPSSDDKRFTVCVEPITDILKPK